MRETYFPSDLPQYDIDCALVETEAYRLYRARQRGTNRRVLLKTMPLREPAEVARLQHEYTISHQLDLAGIVRVIDFVTTEADSILVLADSGGALLAHVLSNGPLPLETALNVARQLAQTLAGLHQRDLIHQAVCPNNVWVNLATGDAKLTGFGDASPLGEEVAVSSHFSLPHLDPHYLAPEQSGRISRCVDHRTDYYALGVLLFEMLSGRVPFQGQERLSLLYAHIAKPPPALRELAPTVPEMVAAIARKLLAKAAEDRYQSGWGLAADLERCLNSLTPEGAIPVFEPGRHDQPLRFELPQRLYGREAELEQLLQRLDATCSGVSQMCLVAGYAGVGKTAFIQALQPHVLQRRGIFVSGKWDKLAHQHPYRAIQQALRELSQWLLAQEQTVLEHFRQRCEATLRENIGIAIEFIPDLRPIFGEIPPVATVALAQKKPRLHQVMAQFLSLFASADRPLVLFLDDLQWADPSSLALLENLLVRAPTHFLLLGTYRDHEVTTRHSLLQTLASCRDKGVAISTLTLRPLGAPAIQAFLADALHTDSERVSWLVELVYRKTVGNPLAMQSLLLDLYHQGLLRLEPDAGWTWDHAAIDEAAVPETIVDLLKLRLQRLPTPVRKAIVMASALDDDFDVQEVAALCGASAKAVTSALAEACRAGVLVRRETRYQFVHDRIKDSAYRLIPEDERPRRHLAIARLLMRQQSGGVSRARLYALAAHFNRAITLLATPQERQQVARLNLRAGRHARSVGAFPAAHHYFQQGLGLLAPDTWTQDYALAHAMHSAASEAAYLNTKFAEANQLAQQIHTHARRPLDRIPAYRTQGLIAFAEHRERDAQRTYLEALRHLDVALPEDPTPKDVEVYASEVARAVDAATVELPLMADPVNKAALQVLVDLTFVAGWSNVALLSLVLCQAVALSLEHGVHPQSIRAFAGFAAVRYRLLRDLAGSQRMVASAWRLIDRFEAQAEQPYCRFLIDAFVEADRIPLGSLYGRFAHTFQLSRQHGDLNVAAACAYQYCVGSFHAGAPLSSLEQVMRRYQVEIEGFDYRMVSTTLRQLHLMVQVLRDGDDGPLTELAVALEGDPQVAVRAAGSRMMVLHLWRRPEAALQALLSTQGLPFQNLPAIPVDFYRCLILLDRHPNLSATQREVHLARVERYRNRLARRADTVPEDYQHKLDLVDAERLRVWGRPAEAMAHYTRAIEGARRSGLVHEEAIANELAVEFHLELGQASVAALYLQGAAAAYVRWGAHAKLAQLYERYSDLLGTTAPRKPVVVRPATTDDHTLATIAASATQDQDLQSVEQAAMALRSELDLPALLSRLMALVLEASGAQRGVLVHEENGGWVIDASATVDAEALRVTAEVSCPVSEDVPATLLHYAARTNDALVLDDVVQDTRFARDTYLRRTRPAALLCTPLVHQSRSVALLYLEHYQLHGVFSKERCAAVQLMAAEAAAALANARTYHELHQELAKRQRAEGELRQALDEVAALHEKLAAENVYLREEIASDHDFTEIVGQSAPVRQVLRQVKLVAPTETSVLILGETGTGKELIARALHDRSPRRHRPLIKVNCAALPATLIESELFGHEQGAFTGALKKKLGRFELADQGTLFLDEIGDLPLALQVKLLRALQEGEFERLGSGQTLHVDVRVISATNRDLPQAVAEGVFRADLYYRLSVFPLHVPPLRERRKDIPLLVWYFISKHQDKVGKRITEVPRGAMATLETYPWPGNVRELESVIERALILSPGTTLVLDDSVLLSQLTSPDDPMSRTAAQGRLHTVEREHISTVLAQCGWRIQGPGNAAERLGLAPSTLRFRMRKLGIKRP